jgi:hypothetical protein
VVERENDGEQEEISTTEDIVYWFETDLSCRMVTSSRSEDRLVGTIGTSYKFG